MKMEWQTPKGTRDFLPAEMKKRQELFAKFRGIFESYGYGEVCTPAFEDFELLATKSGKDIENEIYVFEDKSGRKLGLRFDPTVPVCRIVSSDSSLPKPIRFYYITNMWRYDKPKMGRWREFWQAGVELIGAKGAKADAEMLVLTSDLIKATGVKDFVIKISSRKILESFAKQAGIPEDKKLDAFRAIDKLAKIGEDGVIKEFAGYKIPVEAGKKLLELVKKGNADKDELQKLNEIVAEAGKFGLKNIEIDLSIVRGIDYYTGFVFETVVKGNEDLGSVCGGGRYDTLVKLYGGEDLPAVGFAFGVDRLLEIADKGGTYFPVQVYVAPVSDEVRDSALKICVDLRRQNIGCETDVMSRSLKKQFDYVNVKKIPFCIVVGPKELKENCVVVRDMSSGKEEKTKIAELAKRFKAS